MKQPQPNPATAPQAYTAPAQYAPIPAPQGQVQQGQTPQGQVAPALVPTQQGQAAMAPPPQGQQVVAQSGRPMPMPTSAQQMPAQAG